ncbi:hypothetical protein, partial [Colidextribacter sp. OB.20]|uniref:hypothetical protein n=1 Tax=Colidextribacter sp. OB.20 TaxID=2304568 RepID=UPI001A9BA5EB
MMGQISSGFVEWLYASWWLPPVSRRICQRYRVALYGDKKNGGFRFLNRPLSSRQMKKRKLGHEGL